MEMEHLQEQETNGQGRPGQSRPYNQIIDICKF